MNIEEIHVFMERRKAMRARARRARLLSYRRKRNRMIMLLRVLLVTAMWNTQRVDREMWTLPRGGQFWEYDSQRMNDGAFQQNYRVSRETFQFLLMRLTPFIMRKDTNMRKAISPGKRLAVTLYILGDNTTYKTAANLFGVSKTSVACIIQQVTLAISTHLFKEFICIPTGQHLQDIINGFRHISGLPNCVGAIDGTHVEIKAPASDPIDYYCRKQKYSIILQAVCDHLGR